MAILDFLSRCTWIRHFGKTGSELFQKPDLDTTKIYLNSDPKLWIEGTLRGKVEGTCVHCLMSPVKNKGPRY